MSTRALSRSLPCEVPLYLPKVLCDHCCASGGQRKLASLHLDTGAAAALQLIGTACIRCVNPQAVAMTAMWSCVGHVTSACSNTSRHDHETTCLCAADAASAAQFDGPQRECAIDWLPGDDALLAALQQCGYRSQDTAGESTSDLQGLHCPDQAGHISGLVADDMPVFAAACL